MYTQSKNGRPNHYLRFDGLACAVPEHTMSQAEATQLAMDVVCQTEQQEKLTRVIYRRARVENRHTVVPHRIALNWKEASQDVDAPVLTENLGPTTRERMQFYIEHAANLAIDAAGKALTQSELETADVTHLVMVSCTGFHAPGVDIELINRLRLPKTTQRVNIGFMGCHGAINGMRTAQGFAALHPNANILLCAVELCSLHYRFIWEPERMMGNSLFADGAAAVVCMGTSVPSAAHWNLVATGSCLLPDSTAEMTWELGDHGFEMSLTAKVPDLIKEHLPGWIKVWLGEHGLKVSDIGSWAIHPGGPRILSAVEECLNLSNETTAVSHAILRDYGNMSSPTVLFILDRMREQQARGPCVVLGFGPGLVAEAALLH